jgi:hypothetical protein
MAALHCLHGAAHVGAVQDVFEVWRKVGHDHRISIRVHVELHMREHERVLRTGFLSSSSDFFVGTGGAILLDGIDKAC